MAGCKQDASLSGDTAAHDHVDTVPWFEDVAAEVGISVVHDSGHRSRFYFPECVAGGGGVFDMNNNGWLDVYIIQSGHINDPPEQRPPNRLFRNRLDGTFEDITESSGAGDRGYGMGLATGDYTNNGFLDLYITNHGRNTLLRNNGDETFTDVTDEAGVGNEAFGAIGVFVDIDADGWLDLFVVNYVHWTVDSELYCTSADGSEEYCSPLAYHAPSDDVLYHNNGNGTFTDISESAGIVLSPGNGLGVVCGDFNNNGWQDIYVSNDGNQNRLWINQHDRTFIDQALQLGVAFDDDGVAKAGMGIDAVDYNDNGWLDVLVVNMFRQTDSFHANHGDYFIDITSTIGLGHVSRRFTRFGIGLIDFDNDGWLDLFQANGDIVIRPPYWDEIDRFAEPDLLMRGDASGRLEEVKPTGGTREDIIATGRAAAFGDLNNDGGIDIVVINKDGPVQVLQNVVADRGHWAMFRVLDTNGRDAIGATVEIHFGDRIIRRDVRTGYSYLAANDPRVHVGLGEIDRIDAIVVHWLGGPSEHFGSFDADAIYTLEYGHGQ